MRPAPWAAGRARSPARRCGPGRWRRRSAPRGGRSRPTGGSTPVPSRTGAPTVRGVAPDVGHHVVAEHEPVGVGPVVGHAGQHQGEVRRDEAEAVPPVQPGTAELVAAVHDHVLDARLRQPVARGQAGLARRRSRGCRCSRCFRPYRQGVDAPCHARHRRRARTPGVGLPPPGRRRGAPFTPARPSGWGESVAPCGNMTASDVMTTTTAGLGASPPPRGPCRRGGEGVRHGRHAGARPRRRERGPPGRALHRHHGTVGVGQVDPHALPGRARHADQRAGRSWATSTSAACPTSS